MPEKIFIDLHSTFIPSINLAVSENAWVTLLIDNAHLQQWSEIEIYDF